jgi:hypothetical protein
MSLSLPNTVKSIVITDQKFISNLYVVDNKVANTIILQFDGTLTSDAHVRLATRGHCNSYYIVRILTNPNNINVIVEDGDSTFITSINKLDSVTVHKPSENSATWGIITRSSNYETGVEMLNLGFGTPVYATLDVDTFLMRTLVSESDSLLLSNDSTYVYLNMTGQSISGFTSIANGSNLVIDNITSGVIYVKSINEGYGIDIVNSISSLVISVETSILNSVNVSSLGGTSLVGNQTGPNMTIKGLSNGSFINIVDNGVSLSANANIGPILNNVNLSSVGGTSLVSNQTGPNLSVKGLSNGSFINIVDNGVSLSANANITSMLNNVRLSSLGGTTLVGNQTGPNLSVKGLSNGSFINIIDNGISLSANANITSMLNNVHLSSLGGTTLVGNQTGPNISIKGLSNGSFLNIVDNGISLSGNVDVSGLGASITLSSAGGTSLVSDGVGPTLEVKGLSNGSFINITDNGISLSANANITSMLNNVHLSSLGGTTLVGNQTGPNISIKGLSNGSFLNIVDNGISLSGNVDVSGLGASIALSSAGGTSLVSDGVGPLLEIKGLSDGSFINITDNGISLSANANITSMLNNVNLSSLGGTTLVGNQTGPNISIKGLSNGSFLNIVDNGISLSGNVDVSGLGASVSLASTGGTSLVFDGAGPALEVKGILNGSFINVVDNTSNVQINMDRSTFYQRNDFTQGIFYSSISGVYDADLLPIGERWTGLDFTAIYTSNNFDIFNGDLRYIGSETAIFMVNWDVQGDFGANTTAEIALYIDTNLVPWSLRRFFENDNGDETQVSGSCIITLTNNDRVFLGGICNDTQLNRPLYYANMCITRVG